MKIIRIKPSLYETVLRKMSRRILGFTYENILNKSHTKNHKVFTVYIFRRARKISL
jgi:hypothetical protein